MPMINVAFLLLIFFLMTAVIEPFDPVVVRPPDAGGDRKVSKDHLILLEADGTLWVDGQRHAVLPPLTMETATLRADRDLAGQRLA